MPDGSPEGSVRSFYKNGYTGVVYFIDRFNPSSSCPFLWIHIQVLRCNFICPDFVRPTPFIFYDANQLIVFCNIYMYPSIVFSLNPTPWRILLSLRGNSCRIMPRIKRSQSGRCFHLRKLYSRDRPLLFILSNERYVSRYLISSSARI